MLTDEKIRGLCERLIGSTTEEESVSLASELKTALHEHIETLRDRAKLAIPDRPK
jgi:hypothetical protein